MKIYITKQVFFIVCILLLFFLYSFVKGYANSKETATPTENASATTIVTTADKNPPDHIDHSTKLPPTLKKHALEPLSDLELEKSSTNNNSQLSQAINNSKSPVNSDLYNNKNSLSDTIDAKNTNLDYSISQLSPKANQSISDSEIYSNDKNSIDSHDINKNTAIKSDFKQTAGANQQKKQLTNISKNYTGFTAPVISKNQVNVLSTFSVANQFKSKKLLRVGERIRHLKIDPLHKKRLAYIQQRTGMLKVVDMSTLLISSVDGPGIGAGFFWSPDGIRIIYRKQLNINKKFKAGLFAFDYRLKKKVKIDDLAYLSGFPVFDPRDYLITLIHQKGVLQKRLRLPKSKLARWNLSRVERSGNFAVSDQNVILLSPSKKGMKKLKDDGSGIQSFDVSPKGDRIAWSTKNHNLFYAHDKWSAIKSIVKRIDFGVDPVWVGDNEHIVYSGVRRIGNKIAGYDLKISDLKDNKAWLTKTYGLQERFPVIMPRNAIFYTVFGTTDIYGLFPRNHDILTNIASNHLNKKHSNGQINK